MTNQTDRSAANPEGAGGLSRRGFVLGSAAVLGATQFGALPSLAGPAPQVGGPDLAAAVAPGAGDGAPMRQFPLSRVHLGAGMLQEKRDRTKAFVRAFDERRFLVLFNQQAGRPNPEGISVPGGWENGGLLSGHWAGHFLTILAQCYADQREQVFKDKLDWMVTELAACQTAITARMDIAGEPEEPPAAVVHWVPGRFGNALVLNGETDAQYVRLPQETATQLKDFTIATWVKLAAGQSWTRIFDFGQNTATNMFLTASAGGGAPRFAITTSGSGGEQQINADAPLPIGEWVHVAVTLSGGTGTLFVNGVVAGQNTGMTLDPTSLGVPGNVWIGRSQYGDPGFDGAIDEFHVFDRALSGGEVASLQTSAAGSTGGGNIAWFRFDETSGTTAKDSSANGRHAGVVAELTAAPDAWVPTHPGYLGALPEDTVLRLGPPRFAVYGGNLRTNTWAPWYTQHKIMRGLLDAYYLAGNQTAKDIVVKMADWAHLALTVGDKNHPDYTGPLTRSDLNFMWDTYIAGEYGGANESFPEIAAITGNDKYLETAKLFDNRESLFQACLENRDILVVMDPKAHGRRRPARLHANQHVPNFLGYLRLFEQTGDADYYTVAKNFYNMVVPHRWYANAGTGGNYPGSNNNTEMFQNRGNIANAIVDSGAESCTTYNVAKLARNLFLHDHDPAYMDVYEQATFNHLPGGRSDSDATNNPQVAYFQKVGNGVPKSYGNTGTCCGGTGPESQTKYQEMVFSQAADGSALWVNQFIPSVLDWTEKGMKFTLETSYPRGNTARLKIQGGGALAVKIRVPGWAKWGFSAVVNGDARKAMAAVPGTYLTLDRTWRHGDVIDITIKMAVRVERAMDKPEIQAIFMGPMLMPILGAREASSFHELTLYKHLKLDGDYGRVAITLAGTNAAGDPLLKTGDLSLRPWYVGDTQPHSAYFRRVEPEIVFGSKASGVPNYKRNDHLPNYDVPVAGVELPGSDGPSFLDLVWDNAPFRNHGHFVSTVARIGAEFVDAGLMTQAEKAKVQSTAARAKADLAV